MFLSVFDIFKIGIGPSSSHTMGPMIAANRFLDVLRDHLAGGGAPPQRITCTLHGSLAFTGKGHGTDRAVILGLLGHSPDRLDPVAMALQEQAVWETGTLEGQGLPLLTFRPAEDVIFDFTEALPAHPNGLVFRAWDTDDTCVLTATYFSIGGGFVLSEAEMDPETASLRVASMGDRAAPEAYPYGFATAREMLAMGQRDGRSIAEMKRANERVDMPEEALNRRLDALWAAMGECLAAGLARRGELPGGLHVKRRAAVIRDQLAAEAQRNLVLPHVANDWLAVYAMAVNEENAAGGRVVTAPTNGAAGVIPAVLYYLIHHCPAVPENAHRDFLLTAAAIGGLIKHNASISGAEVGC
ncbi:MAG: L-serine ammonia-lyase, partial [Magnetospiraceae bacterium]